MATPSDEYGFWLFDLDGTLVDTEWAYKRDLLAAVGEVLDTSFSDEFVGTLWYGLGGRRATLLRDRGLEPERFWRVFDDLDDPRVRAGATYLYPDAGWIGKIDAPCGIVTHCPAEITKPVLASLDIDDWFDAVVPCSDSLGWKPDPAPVERAIGRLPVSPDVPGIMVGDGRADMGAAVNAGLDGAHVERHDSTRRGHCVLGDYRVSGLDELRARTFEARVGAPEPGRPGGNAD